MKKVIRKGRTLSVTVKELMESERLRIAIDNFERDPVFLKAILTELGMECLDVAKRTIIRKYGKSYSLPSFEMKPYLTNTDIDEFSTFGLFWNLTPAEQVLYASDPKVEMSKEDKDQLFERVKQEFLVNNEGEN